MNEAHFGQTYFNASRAVLESSGPPPTGIVEDGAGGYLGRVMQGRRVPLLVWTLGPGSTPGLPVVPPTASLFDAGGNLVLRVELPVLAGGLFGMGVRLGAVVPVGRYCVLYSYVLGDLVGTVLEFLDVVAGDPAGAVISTFAHDRPEARYVLVQVDGGQLLQGRNPGF